MHYSPPVFSIFSFIIIVYNHLTRQEQWEIFKVSTPIESLLQARCYDPFGLLGLLREGAGWVIRVYEPHATDVDLLNNGGADALKRVHRGGVFEWRGNSEPARPYRLRLHYGSAIHEIYDPYQFPPNLPH